MHIAFWGRCLRCLLHLDPGTYHRVTLFYIARVGGTAIRIDIYFNSLQRYYWNEGNLYYPRTSLYADQK